MAEKSDLDTISEDSEARPNPLAIIQKNRGGPLAICINGQAGVGKTTFAAGADNSIGIITERGLGDLEVDHFPLCEKWEQVLECVQRLIKNEHDYKNVFIDSLDWAQELIFDFVCRKHNAPSIEDANGGYGKGYVEALREWRKLLDMLDKLRFKKGMNVILTAHTEVRKVQDPRLPVYDTYAIKLNKRASAVVEEWCDVILFATWDITVKQVKDGGQKRSMALEDAPRVVRTDLSPLYTAKNRFHLPPSLPLSWSAFSTAMRNARAKRQQKAEA
jgi:hypothetical protein